MGGFVNLTCNVFDNVAVGIVKVNITYPDGSWVNATMNEMNNGYYYNTSYNMNGTYYYFVYAEDVLGNKNRSSIYFFKINIPPIANFSYSPLNLTTADTIQFTDLSYDLDGNIVSWLWEFGDGSISNKQNLLHQYSQEGNYVVNLTVWDDDGASNTISKNITVIKPSTDYIAITFATINEILDYNISTNFSFIAYSAAFNYTYGFLGFVNANWTLYGNANATINATYGKCVKFYSGNKNGIAILKAEYNGYNDTVIFTINSSIFSFFFHKGWNLITIPCQNSYTAKSLGQNISTVQLYRDGMPACNNINLI